MTHSYLPHLPHKFILTPQSFPSTDGMHYNDERGANQVREAMKAQGFLASEDAAYWKPFGGTMGIPKVTTVGGRRSSSTSMYLKPALENNSNIQLWTETTVTKIELDKSNVKAIGLNIKRNGEEEKIVLAKDGLVVVSGGGVKTPQLLLESGIGPGLKVPNDAVGKGLTDRTISWVKYNVKGVEKYNIDPPSKEDQDLFVKEGKGPLTQFGPLLVGMIDIDPEVTNDPDKKRKNVVEFFVPAAKDDDIVGVYFVHLTPKKGNGVGAVISIHEDGVVRTDNWGDQWDGDYGTKSTNAAIDVVTKAMENMGYTSAPGGEPWLHPMNHPGGTCGLDTCIDSRTLLVKGLENVAVCDNSIVPEQAIVHTAFSLMAMALRGADILKDFWKVEVVPILEEQKDEL
jgi:choline dehydrogenase-like flavoprotein